MHLHFVIFHFFALLFEPGGVVCGCWVRLMGGEVTFYMPIKVVYFQNLSGMFD